MTRIGISWLQRASEIKAGPTILDLFSGCAGAIPVFLDIARRYDVPSLLDAANSLGEILLQTEIVSDEGISWPSPEKCAKNLVGYSQGAAGIACALAELGRACDDPRFLALAAGALAYERRAFSPERANWPDYRRGPGNSPEVNAYPIAWCHGATGIGISRLRIGRLSGYDPVLQQELDAAVGTVSSCFRQPIRIDSADFSLCHGLAGNADFLLVLAEAFDLPHIRQSVEQFGGWSIEAIQRPGFPWPCGVQGGGETPDLMLGTAGIGYLLLRLYDPFRVPSVLMVPRRR